MAAIWGLIGASERGEIESTGHPLRHRGRQCVTWAPAAHVRFGWRHDELRDDTPGRPHVPLMFTGSLLNRGEIAERLGWRALHGTARADAELLWAFYYTEGAEALAQINGQFALALYDARTDSVVLAIDRWSTQPLYFALVGRRWVFATEYRAMLALQDFEPRIDVQTAGYLQRTKYLPTGRGLLAGVHPVAPGTIVRIRGQSWEQEDYAPLKLDLTESASEEALASDLRAAILSAARRASAGCERIGLALSAGLDSTLTLGAVRAVAPHLPIHTYTASFDPGDPDLALAREAARYFGTQHREILLAPEDLPRHLPQMVWAMEDPCAREEMLVYHIIAHEAAGEVPLVLYGHMADVLFGGMPRHVLIRLAGQLRCARGPLMAFYDYTQTGMVPRSLPGRLLVALYYRGRAVPAPLAIGDEGLLAQTRLHLCDTEPLNSVLVEAIRHPTEVAVIERLHSRAGVRFASLFHDREIAGWAFRVPDRLKIRGRQRKYILRRAAEGILPRSLAARPKGLIRIRQDQRLWQVVEAMAAQLLKSEDVAARGLFDPQDVARLLHRPHGRRVQQEQFYRVWTLLLTEIWCRTFLDAGGAPAEWASHRSSGRIGSASGQRCVRSSRLLQQRAEPDEQREQTDQPAE